MIQEFFDILERKEKEALCRKGFGHDTQKSIECCVWWQEYGQNGRIRATKCNRTQSFARRGKKEARHSSLKTGVSSQGMIKNGKKHTKTEKPAAKVLTERPDFDTFAEEIPSRPRPFLHVEKDQDHRGRWKKE